MAGRIENAFEKAKSSRALGWSYGDSAGAVLFGGILSVLALNRIEDANTIKHVLKRYADDKIDRGKSYIFLLCTGIPCHNSII